MTALKVLGVLICVCFLLGLIRVGGIVEYSAEGLHVWIRAGAFRIHVFPFPKKAKKSKKEKEPKKPKKKKPKKEPEEVQPKSGGPWDLVKRFLPLVGEAAGVLKRRIRIDDLELFFTSGGRNAAQTAMMFGYSNMAVGMIWPVFENNFDIKDYRIRTAVDFTIPAPVIWIRAALSIRIGQVVSFAVIYGIKFFRAYLAGKKAGKTQKG